MTLNQLATALLVGIVALAVNVPWTRAQPIASPAATQLGRTWPPHPAAQWAWVGKGLGNLPPGGEIVIATVPIGSWLTITASKFTENGDVYERTGSGDIVKMVDAVHDKGEEPFLNNGPLGVTFQPGSEVVIKTSSSAAPLDYYGFSGYFVRY